MKNIDRLLNTWFGDVLNQMNQNLLKQNTCVYMHSVDTAEAMVIASAQIIVINV